MTEGGDGTRKRLLAAAEELFAAQGFAATSVRQIIVAAGVGNGAAVGYHFGTKRGLHDAVVERVLGPVVLGLREALGELDARGAPPDAGELTRAWLRPVVALHRTERGARSALLLARQLADARGGEGLALPPALDDLAGRYVARFREALPELAPGEVEWRFWAMNGVLIAFVLGMLDLPGADTDAAVVDRLAAYAQAGFGAPAGDPSRAAPTEP